MKVRSFHCGLFPLKIHGRIHAVNIAPIQLLPQKLHRLSEALEVNNLPFPEELDHIVYIRIIAEPQDVVICDPGLLLWERIP